MTKKYIQEDLIINKSPKSRFAEAIKNVRTNLAFSNIDQEKKLILVTSCEPGDGKSFISANLAVAYAQEGKKVLIIDCDLRKGRQHNIFNVINSVKGGYSNLILNYKDKKQEEFSLKDYIETTCVDNLSILTCGPIPPNPTELLSSNNNEALLKRLSRKFDIIILDCPPVIGLSDTVIMTKYSDANILVISCNDTTTELINRAKKVFQTAGKEITGVIINKMNTKSKKYGYYTESYYGDN